MPAVRLTEEDRIAVNNVRILWGELQGMLGRSMGAQGQDAGAVVAQEFLRALRETGDLLPELAPGLQRASGRLWSDLARKTAQRLAEVRRKGVIFPRW